MLVQVQPGVPYTPLVKLAKTEDSQSSGRSSNLLRSTIWKFDFSKNFWYNIFRKLREITIQNSKWGAKLEFSSLIIRMYFGVISSFFLKIKVLNFDFFKSVCYNIYRSWEKKVFSFLLSSLIESVKPPTSVVRSASRDKGWAPAGFVSKNKLGDKYKAKSLCDFPYGELNGKPKVDTPVLSSESSLRRNMFRRHSSKH